MWKRPVRQRWRSRTARAMITSAIAVSAPRCTGSGRYSPSTTTGSPKANRVAAWPSPQKRPSRPALRPSTLCPTGDERRDRGEMVGIGRVAEAEQDGDRDHDPDGDPVGERRNPVVEAEHRRRDHRTRCASRHLQHRTPARSRLQFATRAPAQTHAGRAVQAAAPDPQAPVPPPPRRSRPRLRGLVHVRVRHRDRERHPLARPGEQEAGRAQRLHLRRRRQPSSRCCAATRRACSSSPTRSRR